MDYGSTLRQAWQITWRYRFLWILGLFVPGAAGTWSAGSGRGGAAPTAGPNGRDLAGWPPEMAQLVSGVSQWVERNPGMILGLIGLALVVGLCFFILSVIAQGGMVWATAAVARGEPMTLGVAWRHGLALGWRFFGLGLLLAAIVLLVGLIGGGLAVLVIAAANAGGEARPALIALSVLLGLGMLLVILPVAIAVTISATFAQRAIAVEDTGPVEGLRRGWRLLWSHLGPSALSWLITVALGLATGLVLALGLGAVAVVVGGLGFGLYTLVGLTTPLFVYGAIGLLVFIAIAWLLSAIVNTFFWSYWTLVYLQLTAPPAIAVARAAA